MNRLQKWVYGNWSVPVVSGVLIIISFAVQRLAEGAANPTVSPQWWLDAGAHATHATAVFTLADVFMVAAAVERKQRTGQPKVAAVYLNANLTQPRRSVEFPFPEFNPMQGMIGVCRPTAGVAECQRTLTGDTPPGHGMPAGSDSVRRRGFVY